MHLRLFCANIETGGAVRVAIMGCDGGRGPEIIVPGGSRAMRELWRSKWQNRGKPLRKGTGGLAPREEKATRGASGQRGEEYVL